jgi:hypothetical protein
VTFLSMLICVISVAAVSNAAPPPSLFEPLWLALDFSSSTELSQLSRVAPKGSATEPAIVEGALFLRSDTGETQQIAIDGGSFRSFHAQFRFRAQWAGANSSFGMILRSNSAKLFKDGVIVRFHPSKDGRMLLTEVAEKNTGRIRKTAHLGAPDDLWHQCEIVLWAGRCRLYVDNSLVLVANSIPVSKGGLGLFVGQGARMWLDDLTVSVE